MKKFLLLGSLLFFFHTSYTQNMEWVKQIGNQKGGIQPTCMERDDYGNIFIFGIMNGLADLDMDTSTYFKYTNTTTCYIAKYSPNGSLIWGHPICKTPWYGADIYMSLKVDHLGNPVISGIFKDSADMDPGPAVHSLYGQWEQPFFCQYDSNGNYVWAFTIDCDNNSICIDTSNNIYFGGSFSGTEDFDPGPGVYNIGSWSSTHAYILKVSTHGDFIWAKTFLGDGSDVYCLALTNNNQLVSLGKFYGTTDFDPNSGLANESTTSPFESIFINSLDTSGNYLWTQKISLDYPMYQAYTLNLKTKQE